MRSTVVEGDAIIYSECNDVGCIDMSIMIKKMHATQISVQIITQMKKINTKHKTKDKPEKGTIPI